MEPNKPTKAIRKDQVWSKRSIHLRSHIDSLGLKKTQQLDAHALVKVFFFRRSLRLKLSDTYLAKVWQMSLRNVQNRLQQLEQADLPGDFFYDSLCEVFWPVECRHERVPNEPRPLPENSLHAELLCSYHFG